MAPKPARGAPSSKVSLSKIFGILGGAATVYLLALKSSHGGGLLLDPSAGLPHHRAVLQLPHAPVRSKEASRQQQESEELLEAVDKQLRELDRKQHLDLAAAQGAPSRGAAAAAAEPKVAPKPSGATEATSDKKQAAASSNAGGRGPEPPEPAAPRSAEDDALDAALSGLELAGPALDGGGGGPEQPEAASGSDEAEPEEAPAGATGKPFWIFCSSQWQECLCGGRIRWGNEDQWKIINVPKGKSQFKQKCNIDLLGDPRPGDDSKHCECEVTPGTSFFKGMNPGLLPTTEERVVTSCDIFKREQQQPEGAELWKAVEAFCDPAWPQSEAGKQAKAAGPRGMDVKVTQNLMRAWTDPRFAGVYDKYFAATGWVDKAFINYYAGPPDGKHAAMTEHLVWSVHEFSAEPIIVFHFGIHTPEAWTPERFPRLVLLNAAPIPGNFGRSFNFNKMRAMLMARTRVGVQLDSDQFVAPGVDAMFKTTAREITKEYPMPILPAHFLDRTPKDLGKYWARYCPKDKCKFQSARWGHAHPTWTYWALPWLGRWLRRNFRDETLPAREGGAMAALRIVDIPEDEDLLNVGTWEEGGNKQWCKLDLPGPDDFTARLQWTPGDRCRVNCGDVGGDKRFHPRGVAKVFYTAHHAVVPKETKHYILELKKKQAEGKLAPPILYKGQFYEDGDALRAANSEITCII